MSNEFIYVVSAKNEVFAAFTDRGKLVKWMNEHVSTLQLRDGTITKLRVNSGEVFRSMEGVFNVITRKEYEVSLFRGDPMNGGREILEDISGSKDRPRAMFVRDGEFWKNENVIVFTSASGEDAVADHIAIFEDGDLIDYAKIDEKQIIKDHSLTILGGCATIDKLS